MSQILSYYDETAKTYKEVRTDQPLPVTTIGSGSGGAENVEITGIGGSATTGQGNADGRAATDIGLDTNSRGFGFNGTSWDRLQVDASKNLKVAIESSTGTMGVQIVGSDIMVPIQYQGSTKGTELIVTASTPIAAAGTHVTAWIDVSQWGVFYPQIVLDREILFNVTVDYANEIAGTTVVAQDGSVTNPASKYQSASSTFGTLAGPFARLTITNNDAASVNLLLLNIRWDTD